MKVILRIGDYYDDGHGRWGSKQFLVNKPLPDDLVISETIGLSFHDLCCDYEQGYLTPEQYTTLKDNGIEIDDLLDFYDGGYHIIDNGDFYEMYFRCCKKADPLLTWEPIVEIQMIRDIGGYGLFSG